MTQQTSARRATSILEVWRHGLLDVCWHLRILHVACRTVDAYKGRPTQLLLALLNRLPKPATRSTKSKYRPPDQLDTRTHDHSISISSEPRSHITVRCDRGPDTHIFLSAFSRARVLHQRLSAHSYDQSAQLSIYQRTNTRQSPTHQRLVRNYSLPSPKSGFLPLGLASHRSTPRLLHASPQCHNWWLALPRST
jgi:hypothetical protein